MENSFEKSPYARAPTLGTVLMVEKTIEKYSGEFNRTEIWKKLPKKVMWQTYLIIIDYLEQSNKIGWDKNGIVVWLWNPALVRKLEAQGLIKV